MGKTLAHRLVRVFDVTPGIGALPQPFLVYARKQLSKGPKGRLGIYRPVHRQAVRAVGIPERCPKVRKLRMGGIVMAIGVGLHTGDFGNGTRTESLLPHVKVVPRLQAACEGRENITILTNTTADEILMNENGAAAGVHAVGKTGNQVVVHAKAVILATGGFGANLPMVASYQPALDGFMTTNAAGAQGQGIAMATAVGADTVDLDQIQIHPTV